MAEKNEKKVWGPLYMYPIDTPAGYPDGPVYFTAIEELQGSWVYYTDRPKEWIEAESTIETIDYLVDEDGDYIKRISKREIQRPRRYVVKQFKSDGSVENIFKDVSFPRKYED